MHALTGNWPTWLVFVAFFAGALARGSATYAVGRGMRVGGERSRWAHHLERPVVAHAERLVQRFGAPAVALGFLTVGLQSAINASAGLLRMPMARFLPGLVCGALLWASLYTAVGLSLGRAILGQRSWWWAVAGVAVVAGLWLGSRALRARWRADGEGSAD